MLPLRLGGQRKEVKSVNGLEVRRRGSIATTQEVHYDE